MWMVTIVRLPTFCQQLPLLVVLTLVTNLLKNIGSLENYGVELAFNVKPIVTKDFVWDVTYNVGWNHNEITQLEAGLQDWVWTGRQGISW